MASSLGPRLEQRRFVSAELLEENVRRMLEPARMGAWFSGTVSLLALIITATGIYGMLSYHVRERTSEIGIRRDSNVTRRTRRNVLACYIPARRATKVDPLVALRTE